MWWQMLAGTCPWILMIIWHSQALNCGLLYAYHALQCPMEALHGCPDAESGSGLHWAGYRLDRGPPLLLASTW